MSYTIPSYSSVASCSSYPNSRITQPTLRVPSELQALEIHQQLEWVVAYLRVDPARYIPQYTPNSPRDPNILVCHLCVSGGKRMVSTDSRLSSRHLSSKAHLKKLCDELNVAHDTLRPPFVTCDDCGQEFGGGRTDTLKRHEKTCPGRRTAATLTSVRAPITRSTSLPNSYRYSPHTISSSSTSPASSASSSPQSFDGNMELHGGQRYSIRHQMPQCKNARQHNLASSDDLMAEIMEVLARPIPGLPGSQYSTYSQATSYDMSQPSNYVNQQRTYM